SVLYRGDLVSDECFFADGPRQPWKVMFECSSRLFARNAFLSAPADLRILDRCEQFMDLKTGVPELEDRHLAVFDHVAAIGRDAGQHRLLRRILVEAIVAAGDDETRRQSLEIPFPRRGQGL